MRKFIRSIERNTRTLPVSVFFVCTVGLLLVSFFLYGYYLHAAIASAVDRETALEGIADANATIADLESSLVDLDRGLSMEKAKALGFHEVADPVYVTLNAESKGAIGLNGGTRGSKQP